MPGVPLNLSPSAYWPLDLGQVQNGSLTSHDHLPSMPRALEAWVGLTAHPPLSHEKEPGLVLSPQPSAYFIEHRLLD